MSGRTTNKNKAVKRLSNTADRLYRGFPYRDSVSQSEYIDLVRSYVEPPVTANYTGTESELIKA